MTSPATSASRSARARKGSSSVGRTTNLSHRRRPVPIADLDPDLRRDGKTASSLFQRPEIGDDVGAVLRFGESGEGHLSAFDQRLRLPQPFIELVGIPLLPFVSLHRRGELITGYFRHCLFGDAKEVRPNLVLPALVEGVASRADLGDLLALFRVGIREQRANGLGPGSSTLLGGCCCG